MADKYHTNPNDPYNKERRIANEKEHFNFLKKMFTKSNTKINNNNFTDLNKMSPSKSQKYNAGSRKMRKRMSKRNKKPKRKSIKKRC